MTYSAALKSRYHSAAAVDPTFDRIMQLRYAGETERHVGSELYGDYDLGQGRISNRMFVHTGLVGTAARRPDVVRQNYPIADYFEDEVEIEGYIKLGIAFQYFPAELQGPDAMFVEGMQIITSKVDDLPALLADAEEEERHRLYNNGESQLGGLHHTPLFVDGDTHKLGLVGRPDYFEGTAASNIIYNAGGVSYAFIAMLQQIGANFINEEGRRQRLRVVQIAGSEQNMNLLRFYLEADTNIEQNNPAIRNPVRGFSPNLVSSERFANSDDMIVFLEGWEDDLVEFSRYLGRSETGEEGTLQWRKIITQNTTAFGHAFLFNRRVFLVKGV